MMKGGTMVTFAESAKGGLQKDRRIGDKQTKKNDQEGFMHWGSP